MQLTLIFPQKWGGMHYWPPSDSGEGGRGPLVPLVADPMKLTIYKYYTSIQIFMI